MLKEPVVNDRSNPLVSVIIRDYFSDALGPCLDNILLQEELNNLEILYVDNGQDDRGWVLAQQKAFEFPGIVTLRRNRRPVEGKYDHNLAVRMARGDYVVLLTDDHVFDAAYVRRCVAAMQADPLASFEHIRRRKRAKTGRPNVKGSKLVSVLVYNYNYGKYLRQCLESVAAQTYNNIELIFSDNASTDDSWAIATEFAQRHPNLVTLIRNRRNFGPSANIENCYAQISGQYFCLLCSDDAFAPDFVERCVRALEANPNAAFAMVHRDILDDAGNVTHEAPFYNQSCVISGDEQAAVYMMAAVNPSISQILYDWTKVASLVPAENVLSRWFGQRLMDFNICCNWAMVYLKDPLLLHRVHGASDSVYVAGSLVEAFAQYILPHQFAEIASCRPELGKAVSRLPASLDKVGRICLRYAARALLAKDTTCALRYVYLALAIVPELAKDETQQLLMRAIAAQGAEREPLLAQLAAQQELTARTVSYDPPPGSVPLIEGAPHRNSAR